jgi:thiol-disulfide isomerase/thioredoxin
MKLCYMKKLTLLVLLLPLFTIAQENGIHFEHGSSWAQIKAKAKAENKFIFMDCYATWCVPCQNMSANIFPLEEVGNFMNEKFISVKVQLDMFYGDNDEVRSWYADGHNIEQKYSVKVYPTYLFFDPNADIVHRAAGSGPAAFFLSKAKHALDPETQYYTLLNKYKSGQKDSAFLRKVALAAVDAYEKEEAQKIVAKYLETQKENIYTEDILQFIRKLTTRSSDKGFQIMIEHADKVDAVLGKSIAEQHVANIIIGEEIAKTKPESPYKKPNWLTMSAVIDRYYPTLSPKAVAITKLKWYEYAKDWNNYQIAVDDYVKQSSPDLSLPELNQYAWTVFLHINDTASLQEALGWSNICCKDNIIPMYIDTYANLLYKLGQKEDALSWEQNAINLGTKKERKIYQQTLNKMISGQKTWEW